MNPDHGPSPDAEAAVLAWLDAFQDRTPVRPATARRVSGPLHAALLHLDPAAPGHPARPTTPPPLLP